MWLSRGGVVEQAASSTGPPTVVSAVVQFTPATQSTNTITITMSEACAFTLNEEPSISISSTASAPISITSVSGDPGTTGSITLSRNVTALDTLTLNFSAPNGITSVSTGLSPNGNVAVTNSTEAAGFEFQNFTWSSASAGTSVTSTLNIENEIAFPAQASGLKVSYPNWVGYGAEGSAVTDTNIVAKSNLSVPYGFSTGDSLTQFNVTLVDSSELNPPAEPTGSNVPYLSPTNSGTATATVADKLVNTTAGNVFNDGSVSIGDVVIRGSGGSATVTGIDSATELSISENIMTSGETYIIQTRSMSLTNSELALISLPTVNPQSGKTPAYVEFDVLSLLSTAKGETVTLEYTDAVPAGASNQGSQMSSFFTRFGVTALDVSGEERAIDVRTFEQGPFAGTDSENNYLNAQSGPVTVVPRLHAVAVTQAGEPGVVYGLAHADNSWNLGDFGFSEGFPQPDLSEADITLTLQFNPYVYNNLTTPPPTPQYGALLSLIRAGSDTPDTFTFTTEQFTLIEDFLANPFTSENFELIVNVTNPLGQPVTQLDVVGNPTTTFLAPGMQIVSLTDPGITIPVSPPTLIQTAVPYYDTPTAQWGTRITLNQPVTAATGTYQIQTPNLGYVNITLGETGSSGVPLFPGSSTTNPFAFSISTPAGVADINYNGLEGPRASIAPANYITQTITGDYPSP